MKHLTKEKKYDMEMEKVKGMESYLMHMQKDINKTEQQLLKLKLNAIYLLYCHQTLR